MLPAAHETANTRFKRRSGDWYWLSIAVAAALHFVLFAFWPQMSVAELPRDGDAIPVLELPPDIVIPPPPELITRPAAPVISSADIDDAITIPPTTFDAHRPETLAAPRSARPGRADPNVFSFTPMTVAPRLLNTEEVQRALQRNFPRQLQDAGIGGTVVVQFFIDERGMVLRRQLREPSSWPAFDQAALDVAAVMRFAPAINRDQKVPVWVEIPVVFRVR
jgi:periplasmic protein TonB